MTVIDEMKAEVMPLPSDFSTTTSLPTSNSHPTTSDTTSIHNANTTQSEILPNDTGNGNLTVTSQPAPSFSFSAKPVDWLQQGKTVK
jgi:hypothetical protein